MERRALHRYERAAHDAVYDIFHRARHRRRLQIGGCRHREVFEHSAAVRRAQFGAGIRLNAVEIPRLAHRNRIRSLGIDVLDDEITVRRRRRRLNFAADFHACRRPFHGYALGILDESRNVGGGFFLIVAVDKIVILIQQRIVVGRLRFAERAAPAPSVPIPVGFRDIARAELIDLTERDRNRIVFFDHDLFIGHHDLDRISRVVCLRTVVKRAAFEVDFVVDQSVPAAPKTARALHDARFAVNAQIDLIIVALRTSAAVAERIEVKLDAVAARHGVVVGVALGKQNGIGYVEQEKERVFSAVNLHRYRVFSVDLFAERRKRLFDRLPLRIIALAVDLELGGRIVAVKVERAAAGLFLGIVILVNVVLGHASAALTVSARSRAATRAGGSRYGKRRDHKRRAKPFCLFHNISSLFFCGRFRPRPFNL